MASILRSSKFVRYIVGFTRNVANINQIREFDNASIQNGQCLCNILTRTLTSETVTHAREQSLERNLRRLDQDVRRSGRISRRDIEDILEELRSTRSASSSQSLLIIRCCGNLVPEEKPEVRTELVQQIWKTLNKLNVPMDISHYNALLRVYLENEHDFSPVDFLAELEKAGVEPNRVTYQRLIAKYCQQGDIEGATKILEFMREKQLPVNENVFNALIMGHSQAEDIESAKGILTVMQQAGLEPSADTYTTLLCGYARSGNITAIKETIEQCQAKEVSLLDKDILDIIYALAINGHTNHVPELIPHLKKSFGYNQDCINLILKLINKGCDATAIDMLRTMPSPSGTEPQFIGGFLISHMVKSNRPAEKVIEFAKLLEDEGLNPKALLIAADTSIKASNIDVAYPVFAELLKSGLPVRSHYFWPLIIGESRKYGNKGVAQVLRKMSSDFELTVDGETVRDYVIPNLKFQSPDQAIEFLRDSGVSIASAATNLVYHYLVKHDLATAADVAFRYTAHYSPNLLRKPLAFAVLKSKDFDSWVAIVRQVCDNLKRAETVFQSDLPETDQRLDKASVVGSFVLDIAQLGRQQRLENLGLVLNTLVNQGLSISNKSAERLQELLGDTITPEITSQLQKLTSGELTPIPLLKSTSTKTVSGIASASQIERLIKANEAKNENVNGLKRQLISTHCKNRDTEKLEETLSSLSPDFEFTPGLYAQLIDYYSSVENLEKASEYKEKLDKLDPNFAMDDTKCIKYVSLLVKNGRFEEAYTFLKSQSRERKLEERSFAYNTQCWKLLGSLAEQGNEKELNNLFNVLLEKDYIEPSNVLLGPLVKVHLVNDNVTKAIEEFERCCTKYRTTPCKNELTCKLIQNEDATNLQKLTDLSTQIHGEVNSLYDLVFAFVECGRVRQARKILETPGLRNRQQRVDTICERYSQEGQNDPLEGLIEATKDLHHIDRSKIFLHLLTTYIKQDKPENALGLWVRMQEEETQPTEEFLIKLGNFLQSKNVQVPFQIPEKSTPKPTEPVDNLKEFRKAIRANDLQSALKLKKSIDSTQLSITDQSGLIECLIKAERLNEAKREVISLLDQDAYPIPRVFKFFLNKLALAGDVDTLNAIGEKLKPELKKVLSFDNRVCHANIVAGKSEDMLASMETAIDNVEKDQIAEIANTFPRGGAMGILEAHPELVPRFEEVAKKYAAHGIVAPANVLWIKYFISNNDADATRIWNQYLKDSPRIMFQRVVQFARDTKDDEIVRKLIQTLRSTKVTEGAFGNAYSCLIDILIAKEKYDDALNELKLALNDTCLENVNRTALQRLKQNLEKAGKKFPYEIPVKNAKSSSSSSDDEKKR